MSDPPLTTHDHETTPRPDDLQTRLTDSRVGRAVVAIGVIVMAFFVIAPNMPPSAVRDDVDVLWAIAEDAGLAQDWGVFSPIPRDQSLDVRARITYADGSTVIWEVPDLDPMIGAYREYRWNKWQERVRLDARDDLWDPTAAWIADQHRRDGDLPITVTLIRRWIDHEPLTADGAVDSGWNEFEFHTWTAPENDP